MKAHPAHLTRYPNGFELLFVPNRTAPVLAMDLWVRAGSTSEGPGEAGLAHVVEHMIFKGTATRGPGVLARDIEAVGGEVNAYTSFDETVYSVVVASRFADLALERLAEAIFGATFDPAELAREALVVLEEIRRSNDLPAHRVSRRLFAECFGVHPYGRPVIGDEASVGALDRAACRRFARRWYQPPHLLLVVAGDAEPRELARRVGAIFGVAGRPGRPRPLRRPREPRRVGFRAAFEAGPTDEVYFDLAFPGPSARHPDVPALDLLIALLGQGESSRLQHRVKLDRNLVHAVGAGAFTPRDPGLLFLGGAAEPRRFAAAYEAICAEVFRLRREPVGPKELERAREGLEADFVFQRETVQGQAHKAGFFQVALGDAAAEEAYLERVRRVGPADLQAAARRWLRADRATLVALHPAGAQGLDPARAAALTEAAGTRRFVPVGRGTGLVQRTLPNGARVAVKANREVPVVAVRAAFLGGTRLEPEALGGAFHLMANGLVRGTRSRTLFDVAHEVDALGGQLDGFSGRSSFGLKAEFLAKYLEDGLDLFAEVLCHPTFPEEEVEKLREDALAALRLRRDNPAALAIRRFEEGLFPTHPFGRDVLGRPETLARIGAPELRRLFAAAARPETLAVAVAGDVDPELVFEFFTQALAALVPAGESLPAPGPVPLPGGPVSGREVAALEQSHVLVGFGGPSLRHPDRHALGVAGALLGGQGGRLFQRLRDELGLAYAVTSIGSESLDGGYLAGYTATSPGNADRARRELAREFERLAAETPPADEVAQAQRKLVGGFEIALQENATQAAMMAMDEVYGLGYRSFQAYARRVLAVSPAQVRAAAARYFRPEAEVTVTLGP